MKDNRLINFTTEELEILIDYIKEISIYYAIKKEDIINIINEIYDNEKLETKDLTTIIEISSKYFELLTIKKNNNKEKIINEAITSIITENKLEKSSKEYQDEILSKKKLLV